MLPRKGIHSELKYYLTYFLDNQEIFINFAMLEMEAVY